MKHNGRFLALGIGIASAAAGIGIASTVAAVQMIRRKSYDLDDKTVVITGGSRGLGLVLGREFMRHGARVAILGRDRGVLERAEHDLRRFGDKVLAIRCDVRLRNEVEDAIEQVHAQMGAVDVLVNNAGTISVGPVEVTTEDDFRDSIDTHFWAPYYTTLGVLREMKRRGQGRIVNISSIGGKVSVPHLLPYSVGKFALTGFSEGLRSALLKDNILVTTVCPGLMRTGSPRNAFFKGNNQAEYAWFSISDSLPGLSISAESAARRIVEACIRGEAEVVLSFQAKAAVKLNALFPGTMTWILATMNKALPRPAKIGEGVKTGKESFSRVSPSIATFLTERAAFRNNQVH